MTHVLLLHGLGRNPLSFWRMSRRLERDGYQTIAPFYGLPRTGLRDLAASLMRHVPARGVVSMVGHSLGGLIAVRLMNALPEERRGRIVQLGAPNLGSEAAREARPLQPILGPILDDLTPHRSADAGKLEIGAIAGTGGPDVLRRITGLQGPNDGLVTVRSAWAASRPVNRVAFPVAHTFIMANSRVIAATLAFLKDGRF